MPRTSSRPPLVLKDDERESLENISRSRTEGAARVLRSRILLQYAAGTKVSDIVLGLREDRPKVQRCIEKAIEMGPLAALDDLKRTGRPQVIPGEAKTWVASVACQRPADLGLASELWNHSSLAQYVRQNCEAAGHPSLRLTGKSAIHRILSANSLHPERMRYYLERRDPEFDQKMANVLLLYKTVECALSDDAVDDKVAYVSYDEKPGIQAIACTAADLRPVPGVHPCVSRDHEYVRHGTVSLMAGIDLVTGEITARVEDKHASPQFVAFLRDLNARYRDREQIRVVLDNLSVHTSKETREYLASVPGRFEFIFTPKHASWLNLVETLFGKLARTMLKGIRVKSKEELRQRILDHIATLNQDPVVFRWHYKMDTISLV